MKGTIAHRLAAIESDFDLGRPLGIIAKIDETTGERLAPVLETLRPIGAGVLDRRFGHVGSDVAPLQDAGVVGFAPRVDARHDFDRHHTPAVTLDEVDPDAPRRQVSVLAVPVYFLAETAEPIAAGSSRDK